MKRKLNLDLAGLAVESFETFVRDGNRGTVNAHLGCVTWSCGGTCGAAPDSLIEKEGATLAGCSNNCCA